WNDSPPPSVCWNCIVSRIPLPAISRCNSCCEDWSAPALASKKSFPPRKPKNRLTLAGFVIHGDRVTIGNYVRIDYGARVLDGRPADETYIRDNCWVGMNATVRGSRMEEGSAVGNGAVADFNTHLEKGAVLAHGGVTLHDTVIPAGALAEGLPAQATQKTVNEGARQQIFGLI